MLKLTDCLVVKLQFGHLKITIFIFKKLMMGSQMAFAICERGVDWLIDWLVCKITVVF